MAFDETALPILAKGKNTNTKLMVMPENQPGPPGQGHINFVIHG